MKTVSDRVAEFATTLRYEEIPSEVVERARLHLLDAVGIGLAATREPYADALTALVREWGGSPQATLWRFGDRLPAAHAALANGAYVHGLDFDDTHSESIVHMSAVVVPTAIAVGEAVGASGKDVLAAMVVGYEVAARVGAAAPGAFHERGYHATPLCGAFAAAAIAARMWGLDAAGTANALGTVGSQAAGLQEFLNDGSWVKRLHPGWAAHSGIAAAQLARHGFLGPRRVFEGNFGFYATHLFGAEVDAERVAADLGERWETLENSFKPYPCCHFSHASMDAARELVREHALSPEQIEEIEAIVPEQVVPIICEPVDHKRRPNTPYAALFSLPYSIALCVVRGDATLDDFDEGALGDPAVLAMAAKVRHRGVSSDRFPRYFHGAVRMRLTDGRELTREEPVNRGHPERPLTREEVEAKFRANAARVLGPAQVDGVVEAAMGLGVGSGLSDLVGALVAR